MIDALVTRLQKLLARVASSNAYEAEEAARQARALVVKHGVALLLAAADPPRWYALDGEVSYDREVLAQIVAHAQGCRIGVREGRGIGVWGRRAPTRRTVARYRAMIASIEESWRAEWMRRCGYIPGYWSLEAAWRSGYWRGFVDAVGTRAWARDRPVGRPAGAACDAAAREYVRSQLDAAASDPGGGPREGSDRDLPMSAPSAVAAPCGPDPPGYEEAYVTGYEAGGHFDLGAPAAHVRRPEVRPQRLLVAPAPPQARGSPGRLDRAAPARYDSLHAKLQ